MSTTIPLDSGPPRPPRPKGRYWRWGPSPTEAQQRAHAVAHHPEDVDGLWDWCPPAPYRSACLPAPTPIGHGWWRPHADGVGVPWPTIITDTRWDFADGSWCEGHPGAAGLEWLDELRGHGEPGWTGPCGDYVLHSGAWRAGTRCGRCGGLRIADRVWAAYDARELAAFAAAFAAREWTADDFEGAGRPPRQR